MTEKQKVQRLESLLKSLDDVDKRISSGEARLRIANLALNARSHEMHEQEEGLVKRFYQVFFEDYQAICKFLDLYDSMERSGEMDPMPEKKREHYESHRESHREALIKLEGYFSIQGDSPDYAEED